VEYALLRDSRRKNGPVLVAMGIGMLYVRNLCLAYRFALAKLAQGRITRLTYRRAHAVPLKPSKMILYVLRRADHGAVEIMVPMHDPI